MLALADDQVSMKFWWGRFGSNFPQHSDRKTSKRFKIMSQEEKE